MTLIKHELKQGWKSFAIWTITIAFLVVIVVLLFPEMKGDMDSFTDMFGSMGSFSDAFHLDKINFGTLIGFYTLECGNILGLGGAFFAALIAVSALAKEEKDHTADFLLTHPNSRFHVITQKIIAVFLQIIAMNVIIYLLALASIAIIGEPIPWEEFSLLHLSFLLLQIELACICFGISAFLKRGSLGIGLGFAALMYFLNIIANISKSAEFLKYITPFGYTEGAYIIENVSLDSTLLLIGMSFAIVGVAAAYIKYVNKDIQ